jgi:two-component system chemotaxis response regulator CheB
MVSRIRVITHPRARLGRLGKSGPTEQSTPSVPSSDDRRIVAVGASTGGPGALLTIFSALPKDFSLPILLVLHISEPFSLALAEWLDAQLPQEVRYAVDGEPIPTPGRGCVLMAPPDRHLEVVEGQLRLSDGAERHSCRPSVDVLFESLAREMGTQTIGCLLTGMGRDGAKGLLAIKESGGLTIAQDEATSVVFGMPGEAIKLGGATRILPLTDIAPMIVRAATPATRQETRK